MVVKEIKLGVLIATLCGLASTAIMFAYDSLSGTAPLLIVMALIVVSALVLEAAASPKKQSHPALGANAQPNAIAAAAGIGSSGLASEGMNLPATAQLGSGPVFNPFIAGISSRQSA